MSTLGLPLRVTRLDWHSRSPVTMYTQHVVTQPLTLSLCLSSGEGESHGDDRG